VIPDEEIKEMARMYGVPIERPIRGLYRLTEKGRLLYKAII